MKPYQISENIKQRIDALVEQGFEADELLMEYCNLCTCGTLESNSILLYVLEWCDLSFDEKKDDHILGEKGLYTNVAFELAGKVLNKEDLVEHGTGMGWPWTTELGKEFLRILKTI